MFLLLYFDHFLFVFGGNLNFLLLIGPNEMVDLSKLRKKAASPFTEEPVLLMSIPDSPVETVGQKVQFATPADGIFAFTEAGREVSGMYNKIICFFGVSDGTFTIMAVAKGQFEKDLVS